MRFALAVTLAATLALPVSAQERPATVVRLSPDSTLPLDAVITVIFDAPVLRALPRDSSDASRYLSIEPAVRGVAEWRDPVTLRFRPAEAYAPGTRYTIRVRDGAPGDTGRARVTPFVRTITAEPPRILGMELPHRDFLPRDPRILLLYSASPGRTEVGRVLRLEFDDRCAVRHRRLRVVAEREVREDDPPMIRWSGYRGVLTRDLRRVLEVAPDSLLAPGCSGVLVERREANGRADSVTHRISTRDSLRLAAAVCVRWGDSCPRGGIGLRFTTPVHPEDVRRHLRIEPGVPFEVKPMPYRGEDPHTEWWIDTRLRPRTTYRVFVAPGLTDIFGQAVVQDTGRTLRTTELPSVVLVPDADIYYAPGVQPLVRTRVGALDTVRVEHAELAANELLKWLMNGRRPALIGAPTSTFRVPVLPPMPRDSAQPTDVRIPVAAGRPGVTMARIADKPVRVHRTSLAVHARIGVHGGAVLVTGMTDLQPRPGALVTILDSLGTVLATTMTGRDGVGRVMIDATRVDTTVMVRRVAGFHGFVHVSLGDDRTYIELHDATPLGHVTIPHRPDGRYRYPGEPRSLARDPHVLLAGSVTTDRGIYRPGEMLYVRGVVRQGILGALALPTTTDSIRWSIRRRWRSFEPITRSVALSAFGTVADSFRLSTALPLDDYVVALERKILGDWTTFGSTDIRVAEYRAPAFLVTLTAPPALDAGADSLRGAVEARYLFDSPLARAGLRWRAWVATVHGSTLSIPGHTRYRFGHWGPRATARGSATIADTARLGPEGEYRIAIPLDSLPATSLAQVWLDVGVTDADRQEISARSVTTIHPVSHYVGARTGIWITGRRTELDVVAATPEGRRVPGVRVEVLVRRPRDQSWQRMWADSTPLDTVGRCSLRTSTAPVQCGITPAQRGVHEVILASTDARGRPSVTTFTTWANGPAPWDRENPHALEVTAALEEYSPGDTIEVTFTSPFPRATAWITVERETVLASEVREVGAGFITHRLVIPPAWAPNAFISVMLLAPVSKLPVSVQLVPLVVSGRTEVTIAPTGQRLNVAITPRSRRADAGDSVRVDVRVTNQRGRGVRSEIALWAVDEGILSLTGFATPDAITGLYRRRARSMRDASTLVFVAREPSQLDFVGRAGWRLDASGLYGAASVGGVGAARGVEVADAPALQRAERAPRADFRSTAFFIGNARTNAQGRVTVTAKLPDDLTTFRVMAVAVAAGDAYGSDSASFTVTRPLIARPSLPRFVRPGDTFVAGAVVHREDHTPATVRLGVEATGIQLTGDREQELAVRDGLAAEGRFGFRVADRDSVPTDGAARDAVRVRLSVDDGVRSDVVDTRFDIRPDFQPRWHTRTGVVRDTATVELVLPPETDPARSRLVIAAASSPAALIRRATAWFDVYPYACTEQLVSSGFARTSLARAERAAGEPVTLDTVKLQRLVDVVLQRQNSNGGFGYWRRDDWTSYWLTAYAGLFLLEARSLGAAVNAGSLDMASRFLQNQFQRDVDETAHDDWWNIDPRARMSDRVAALDFFQRLGALDRQGYDGDRMREQIPATVALAPRMAWEDRVRLAEVLWRANRTGNRATADMLLRDAWGVATVLGNRLSLPDTLARGTLFFSRARPIARLLTATMAIRPDDARIGPLTELLIVQGRADERWIWSTQDWASAAAALAEIDAGQRAARAEPVRVVAGGRELARLEHGSDSLATSIAPTVVRGTPGDSVRLRFQVRGSGARVFFHASVEEIPRERPLKPDHSGIVVERWYERTTDGAPVTEIAEGELVRVRLRVTVPSDRFFVIVDDALPAGLEVVDLGLRTSSGIGALEAARRLPAGPAVADADPSSPWGQAWAYGSWWSPWDHREFRDDRVMFSARMLWRGTYSATYLARATTAGTFVRPPAHAEEMYNRGVHGRSDGGTFTVREGGR